MQTTEPLNSPKGHYSQSGGLIYHFRALQYRHSLWSSYCQGVQNWLRNWTPKEDKLILIGPSLGWSLSSDFLSRFETVVALDPDPWARWLLGRRFAKNQIRWMKEDALASPNLTALKEQFPEHALLFCNVLGQIPLIYPSLDFPDWKRKFTSQLDDWSWASYHDLYSGQCPPPSPALMEKVRGLRQSPTSSELRLIFARNLDRVGHIQDHETAELFESLRTDRDKTAPPDYLLWEIRPAYLHLIELLRSTKSSSWP